MHFNVVLLLVTIGVSSTFAIVCLPSFCKKVTCDHKVNGNHQCPQGTVRVSGFCGCCTQCLVPLGPGESCAQDLTIPSPPCEFGYECIRGVCRWHH